MPFARQLATNPNDPNQYYILWTNGLVEAKGSNPPPDLPTSSGDQIAAGTVPRITDIQDNLYVMRAIQVTNWTTNPPSGYVMDMYGRIFNFGNATAVPANVQPVTATFPYDNYQDFVMNPAGDGQGYALAGNGSVPNIGGSIQIGGQFDYLGDESAARIEMPNWTSKKYVVYDNLGRRWSRHGAVNIYAKWPGDPTNIPPSQNLYNGAIGSAAVYIDDFDGGTTGHLGRGWALAAFGWIAALGPSGGEAQDVYGEPIHEGWAYSSDLAVINNGLGAQPLQLRVLTIYGTVEEFIVSTPPSVRVDSPKGTVTTTSRPTVGWTYADPEGDAQDEALVRVFDSATYGIGTNEVQRITITGTPTGGTFRLGFKGESTQDIAYNASAANVVTALTALNSIGSGGVTATGGALPGATVDVTFTAALGYWNQPQMTIINKAFTGGSSPNVAVTTVTAGSPGTFDPLANTSPLWETDIGLPAARAARTVQVARDLANGTYRVYMWVKDSSGQVSATDFAQWVQSVTKPAVPTMTITPGLPLSGTLIDLTGTATAGAVYTVEYQDGLGVWLYVKGADALVPDGSGHALVYDREPTFGTARTYRCRQLVPDPVLVGDYSATQTVTINSNDWVLTDTEAASGVIASVRDFDFTRKVVAGTFYPDGRKYSVVITGSQPVKGYDAALKIRTLAQADYNTVDQMVMSGHALLLRDPLGRSAFLQVTGDVKYSQVLARPTVDEDFPVRHLHEIDIPVTQIDRPLVGPSTGQLALTG